MGFRWTLARPVVPRLATRGTRRQRDLESAVFRNRSVRAEQLHRLDAIADFEGQLGGAAETDVFGNLANDGRGLTSRHMGPLTLVDIP